MEACATSHHWARELKALGHEVRLIPPSYVKPFVKRGKNDAVDAEAIFDALNKPTMRFVPVKSIEQQSPLVAHKVRDRLVKIRTMLVNMLRSHMAEFGVVAAQGLGRIDELKAVVDDDRDERIPSPARTALKALLRQLEEVGSTIKALERLIVRHARTNEASRRLAAIPGVGPIGASAFAGSVVDPSLFRSSRHFAAWLGLTPKQKASGLKDRKGRITKMGNSYLRRLLVLGATAMVYRARKSGAVLPLVARLLAKKRPVRLIAVALANKMARIIWVLLARNECYRAAAASGAVATA